MESIKIVNRFTLEVIVEKEANNLKELVEQNRANLREANLYGADLYGADLRGANLYEAKIKTSQKGQIIKSLNLTIED